MHAQLVEQLLPVVNDPAVARALEAYAQYRLGLAQDQIMSAQDQLTLGQIQGKVIEIRNLMGLRDRVVAEAERIRAERGGRNG